jgi:hypothetical protein
MTSFRRLLTAVVLLVTVYAELSGAQKLPMPQQGIVPDEVTAVKIAEIIFPLNFSADVVNKFQPYHAQLKDGVWTVYGTLKFGSRGGTLMMRINKKDGKVLGVWHSG